MAQKITHWLLITLVLSLGFGQLLRFEYLGVPIYLHDVLVVCIIVMQCQTSKLVIPRSIKIFLTGLTLSALVALSHYSFTQLLVPFLYAFRLLTYLVLYFVVKGSKLVIPRTAFVIAGIIMLSIGVLQYFLMPDMRVFSYLGWDDHLNRITLPHYDPTYTAVMLSLALLSLAPRISYYWLYASIYITTILLTYSRSVWLSLAATFTLFIRPKKYLLLIIPITAIVLYLLPKRFGEGNNLLRTYSIESRIASDYSYLHRYLGDIVLGRGMNTFLLDTKSTKIPNHATTPNNSYLYILLTTGFLGLVGWGAFMYSLFIKSNHKPMLTFFLIASLFNNVMFYPFALLWILLVEAKVPSAT